MNAPRSTAVIITAKDAEATIAKAVASSLAQGPVAEVVVVDDGSSDQTSAAAASVDDRSGRLNIIRNPVNKGPSAGRNIGIAASSSPYLCILDADDFMSEGRLERLFDKGGSGWDLLADDMLITAGPTEELVYDKLLLTSFKTPVDLTLPVFVAGNLPRPERHRRELGFLKPLIRRAFLEAHGIRYDERLRLGEDFNLYAECLLAGGRFRVVDACGYYAVERPESLSGHHRTSDIAAWRLSLAELTQRSRKAGRDPGPLAPKANSIRYNLAFRQLLDRKREGDWPGAFAAFLDSPGGAVHIVTEIARAKLGR
jgi:succinoglycan biosynthesis protein ExoU